MSFHSTSVQFSAAYGSAMVSTKPKKIEVPDMSRAQKADVQTWTGTWEELWGVETTETVAEDGTVTRTMSGSVNVGSMNSSVCMQGKAAFSVSVSFHPDSYQDGGLTEMTDLLPAAHAAAQAAIRSTFTGGEQIKQLQNLDNLYDQRKEEAASSFADMVGNYLEASSPTGQEREKVYTSVHALFASAEAKYQKVTDENGQALWMRESFSASVASLRRLSASIRMDGIGKGLYSLQMLEAAAGRVCRGFSISC